MTERVIVCRTSRMFYRIRQALLAAAPRDRRAVRPDTRLEDLIPLVVRRKVWWGLEGRVRQLPLPALRLTPAKRWTLWGLSTAWVLAATVLLPSPVLIAVTTAAVGLILSLTGWHMADQFPPGLVTVRDLVHSLTRGRTSSLIQPVKAMTREEISLRVREIVAENTGFPIEKVTEATSFIEDMGID